MSTHGCFSPSFPLFLSIWLSQPDVVVGTSRVVVVVVDGGVWLLDSNVWSQQSSIEKGGKGEQSNREYSSKVLASKELHYICMHWYEIEKGYHMCTELQNAGIRGG